MLEQTFCHVQGITPAFEQLLWQNGVKHWDDFLANVDQLPMLPKTKLAKIHSELPASKQALQRKDLSYFKATLPPKEQWRLASLGKIGYVDIETTGLSRWSDQITVLGIYDGKTPFLYVNGKNLHEAKAKLQEFDIVVTFNGKQFDMPFIEHHFACTYDVVHLDLRYMLKELGYHGGLKKIERELGLVRDASVQHVDGFEAVRLWHRYQRGHQESLQKLLKYNEEDVVNLQALLKHYLKTKQALFAGTVSAPTFV